jgi:NAD kinase
VANGGVPPQLEGRGIHKVGGKLVLTLLATGHSAVVGEEERCVLAGVVGDDGALQRKQRKVACGDVPVRLPLHEQLRLRN